MATGFQGAFVGGELDPALSARVDISKYSVGCRKLTNFIVQPHGGIYRRPGLSYLVTALGITRLVEFQYNVDQTYVLAFSDDAMMVLADGAIVLDSDLTTTIVSISKEDGAQIVATGHGLTTGDWVYLTGGDMTEIEGRLFQVTVDDVDTVTIDLDTTDYTTYTSGGTIAKLYTLTSPYDEDDLFDLYFAQSADTMYITHPSYAPRKLTRDSTDNDDWSFTTISLGATITPPVDNLTADFDGQDLLEAEQAITGATNDDPAVFTDNAHGLAVGDYLYLSDFSGGTWNTLDDTVQQVSTVPTVNTFTLKDVDGTSLGAFSSGNYEAFTSGGYYNRYVITSLDADGEESLQSAEVSCLAPLAEEWDAGDHIHIGFDAVTGAVEYNIYKERNGLYGYIGTTPSAGEEAFRDENYEPDLLYVPATNYNPFSSGSDYYPSSVAFFKQRLWFAGSNSYPQSLWASQVGTFENFNKARPIRDSDSMAFTLASTQVNAIKWLVPFQELIVGTSGAEWQIFSSSGGTYTPSTTDTKVQSYWGSAATKPLVIGDSILHIQAQGGKVRDLFFSLEKDGYSGNDLTVLVNHLFQGKTVKDWAYQRSPDSVLWCVMSDGSLYAMTYLKEQQVFAWHKHESNSGSFESVAAIPGSLYDDVYVVVNRGTINGTANTRFIEKISDKWLYGDDIEDARFLDSALTYDGAAATTLYGLDHLEGETVHIMADGIPLSDETVENGEITIDTAASVVHAGYNYTSTVRTMSIEQAGREAASVGRVKSHTKIVARFYATVGGKIGPAEDYTDSLKFSPDTYGQAIEPDETLDYEFMMPANYDRDGSIYVIQNQPYPMTVLALMPEFVVGGM